MILCTELKQVAQQAAESKAEQPAASTAEQKAPPDTVHKVASNVEVDTTAVAVEQAEEKVEESALPKCIGPGCENNAQPDSVYCGPDCILKHAAATMKSITDPSQKDKAKPQKSKTKVTRAIPTLNLSCPPQKVGVIVILTCLVRIINGKT